MISKLREYIRKICIYLMDIKGCKMKELDKFNLWYEANHKDKPINSSLQDYKRWFLLEMSSFYSISGSITATWKSPEYFDKFEVRELAYPLIRRLLETYFRVLYIFDERATLEQKMNDYIGYVKNLYHKCYNDIQSIDQFLTNANIQHKSYVNQLPSIDKGTPNKCYDNVKSMLEQVKNSAGSNFGDFYLWYRIASFYTHGNINFELWNIISPNNNNFPIIHIYDLFELMAKDYNKIINEYDL